MQININLFGLINCALLIVILINVLEIKELESYYKAFVKGCFERFQQNLSPYGEKKDDKGRIHKE